MFVLSQDLNAISIGEEEAIHLGIEIETIKKILFLVTALITGAVVSISGIIGFAIIKALNFSQDNLSITGKTISLAVGILLLVTGILQIRIKTRGTKKLKDLSNSDGVLLGFAQGFSSLPGLSRSGITISTLMLRKFNDTSALRLSFLMSLPIVLIGNIFLNIPDFSLTKLSIYGLIASFAFGLLTIHILMKLSRKINFGWFVLIFAILMILSFFV